MAALRLIAAHDFSQRRACRLLEVDPKTVRRPERRGDEAVRARLRAMAGEPFDPPRSTHAGVDQITPISPRSLEPFSFIGRLRDDLLNEEIFDDLGHAGRLLERWRTRLQPGPAALRPRGGLAPAQVRPLAAAARPGLR